MAGAGGDPRSAGADRSDAVIGLLLLALGATVFWLSRAIPEPPFVPLTPAFFPRVVAGVLALLAVLLLARGLGGARRRAAPAPRRGPLGPAVLLFGWLAGYLLVAPVLGFFTSTFLFVLGLGFSLSPRRPRDAAGALGLAAGTTALCYAVFTRYLHVLFPEGLLR